MTPTTAAAPTAPATMAPVLRGFFSGAVIVAVAVELGAVPPEGVVGGETVDGVEAVGTVTVAGAGAGTAVDGMGLFFPTGAHHVGRGEHAAGALGKTFWAAEAVAVPYFPS
jgi:hypothetical protein